jgi:hypothetical protein
VVRTIWCVVFAVAALSPSVLPASPADVSFSQPAAQIDRFDFVEIAATVRAPDARDPFEDATLAGTLETADGSRHWTVEGFCDSTDGGLFRIRFMAPIAGDYKYSVTYRQGGFTKSSNGTFSAVEAHKRGILADDPDYPWHFIWTGTGEHYFFNGTTAYWLVGWRDDHVIQYSVDRLHRLKVNRLRVTIAGREAVTLFGEPVMYGANWTALIAAWPAQSADDPLHPGFDYSFARDRDMIISLVLDMGDSKVHPVAGSEDERRFIRYAVNRFSAFSNITWDLGDDLDSYRDEKWTHETGMMIQELDPYKQLETSHPAASNDHQDRASSWFGFTSYQEWSREQHALILASRKLQEKTGRIIPQTNEEYGYEDHYPHWALPESDSADALRRTAWDIYMAGGYQTSGESARRGTNIGPDMGGGWLNARGDDTMTMFLGYGHIVDFFTSFEWWKTNPHDELVNNGNYCIADPGKTYAVYLPHGGQVTVQLQPGHYRTTWFSAMTGEKIELPAADGPLWTSPDAPDHNDWALLLQAM